MYYVHSLGIGTFFALYVQLNLAKKRLSSLTFVHYLLAKIDIDNQICMTILNLKLLSCKSIEIQLMQKNDLRLTKKAENKNKEL